jgi:tRNA threonylcarbamoyladenosine biosynthesis protein TsaB
MTACLLAIDASTEQVELALASRGTVWAATLPGGAQASRQLLPAVAALSVQANCSLADLDGVAYGAGPGAFTGLRTACSMAQGLGFGLARPTVALDTLAVLAEDAVLQGAPDRLWATLDARMGEIYAAPLQRVGPGRWRALRPTALYTPAALLDAVAQAGLGDAVAGPALQAYAELAQAEHRWPQARPAGAALIASAQAAWAAGEARAAHQALPLYGRDKVAQTSAERAAIRAATRVATRAASRAGAGA